MNTNFTRELMYGKRPIRRTDPKPGQSEWYYPRYLKHITIQHTAGA